MCEGDIFLSKHVAFRFYEVAKYFKHLQISNQRPRKVTALCLEGLSLYVRS